jgi:hypothetical protein
MCMIVTESEAEREWRMIAGLLSGRSCFSLAPFGSLVNSPTAVFSFHRHRLDLDLPKLISMGRRPKAWVRRFFNRGAKLDDASNRYEHTCKACGEEVRFTEFVQST